MLRHAASDALHPTCTQVFNCFPIWFNLGITRMELLLDNATVPIDILHPFGCIQVSRSTRSWFSRWRHVAKSYWLHCVCFTQVCPEIRTAGPSRPCYWPSRGCCVLHSNLWGEVWSITPSILPGDIQPGELHWGQLSSWKKTCPWGIPARPNL